jgi:hypothetical protein
MQVSSFQVPIELLYKQWNSDAIVCFLLAIYLAQRFICLKNYNLIFLNICLFRITTYITSDLQYMIHASFRNCSRNNGSLPTSEYSSLTRWEHSFCVTNWLKLTEILASYRSSVRISAGTAAILSLLMCLLSYSKQMRR